MRTLLYGEIEIHATQCQLLIGDHVETEVVTGAVVSVRKAGDKLALWIKEADDLETVVKVVFLDIGHPGP